MQKQKKNIKEEMYHAIELWQESGMSPKAFCLKEKLSLPSFGYWLGKYRNGQQSLPQEKTSGTFIPVEVPEAKRVESSFSAVSNIEVFFPNGVRLSCPTGVDIAQLKTLINF